MPISLPVVDGADGTFVTSLEGSRFRFRTRWNSRTACWYLSIETDSGEVITAFEKVLPRVPLVNHNKGMFVSGNVYAMSATIDNTVSIDRDNFGTDSKEFSLIYLSDSEING